MVMMPDTFWFRASHFVYFDDLARIATIFDSSAGIIAVKDKNHGTRNRTQHQLLQHI